MKYYYYFFYQLIGFVDDMIENIEQYFVESDQKIEHKISSTSTLQNQNICQTLKKFTNSLDIFINLLKQIANEPINLKKYGFTIIGQNQIQQVDLPILRSLMRSNIRKMQTNKKIKINWNQQDIIILIWTIEKYSIITNKIPQSYNQDDWNFIGNVVPGKDGQDCMFRWLGLKANRNQKITWKQEEDIILKEYVEQNRNKCWLEIAKKLFFSNKRLYYRTPKQCRERWLCFLDPGIKKGYWNQEQDLKMLKQYEKIGKKWSRIKKVLVNRTENAIKNRFRLIMKKYSEVSQQQTQREYIQQYIKNLEERNKITTFQTFTTDFTQDLVTFVNGDEFINQSQYSFQKRIRPCNNIFSSKLIKNMNKQQIRDNNIRKNEQAQEQLTILEIMNSFNNDQQVYD